MKKLTLFKKKNVKVTLFEEKVVLDKKIIVSLDNSIEVFPMFKGKGIEDYSYAGSCKEVYEQIKERRPFIITCQTHIISAELMSMGYDIYVQNGNQCIQYSKLLKDRCVRETQNWEKMLYSGCFDIEVPNWF